MFNTNRKIQQIEPKQLYKKSSKLNNRKMTGFLSDTSLAH